MFCSNINVHCLKKDSLQGITRNMGDEIAEIFNSFQTYLTDEDELREVYPNNILLILKLCERITYMLNNRTTTLNKFSSV